MKNLKFYFCFHTLILINSFYCFIDNFQRFVVRKLIDLELKINRLNTNLKLVLDKLSSGILEVVEKDTIDVFQDLPLKNFNDLEAMEIKLKNDVPYQMVNRICLL